MSPMWKILQIQEIFRSINRYLITNQKLVLSVIRPKGTILPKYIWTMAMPLVPTRSYFTGKVHTAAKVLLHQCCLAFQPISLICF